MFAAAMARGLAAVVVLVSLALTGAVAATPEVEAEYDVCVVGGGPGGLAAAAQLRNNGYSAVLVEKSNQTGGQALGVRGGLDVGAILITHRECMPAPYVYADELNVAANRVPFSAALWELDTGRRADASDLFEAYRLGVMLPALKRYEELWNAMPQLADPLGAADAMDAHPELADDVLSWLENNNLLVLEPLFRLLGFTFGYGRLEESPALYLLRYFTPCYVGKMVDAPPGEPAIMMWEGGYGALMEKLGKRLDSTGVDVLLSTSAVNLTRPQPGEEGPLLLDVASADDHVRTLSCGSVIDTTFERSWRNLDARESAAFANVSHIAYVSAVATVDPPVPARFGYQMTRLPDGKVAENGQGGALVESPAAVSELLINNVLGRDTDSPLDASDVLIYYNRNWSSPLGEHNSSIGVAYSISDDKSVTPEAAATAIAETLARYPGSSAEVRPDETWVWDYFLHFGTAALRANATQELHALQGHRGTYTAGGLMSFWDVPNTMAFSHALVAKHFPPKNAADADTSIATE